MDSARKVGRPKRLPGEKPPPHSVWVSLGKDLHEWVVRGAADNAMSLSGFVRHQLAKRRADILKAD